MISALNLTAMGHALSPRRMGCDYNCGDRACPVRPYVEMIAVILWANTQVRPYVVVLLILLTTVITATTM
ncbi:MAG: hypothetical protein LBK58_02535 [Prevotellaceae bacterium]|nr:hypothetical protein [Prevotellaceae bacterium]